jgi:hypothetical protein
MSVRCPEPVEVAAYYVASEALANAMKHARASHVEISLAARNGSLLLSIRDDGIGGADSADPAWPASTALLPFLLGGADQDLVDRRVPRPGNDVADRVGDVLGFHPLPELGSYGVEYLGPVMVG